MGRYYNGDIEGKFMFAVQSSNAADRFGAEGCINYVQYYFDEEHLDTINEELEELQEAYDKVAKFFENRDSWNNEARDKAGLTRQDMSDYADYVLGKKIKDCIIEQGSCSFDAEL
jgi:hypothetical protein